MAEERNWNLVNWQYSKEFRKFNLESASNTIVYPFEYLFLNCSAKEFLVGLLT